MQDSSDFKISYTVRIGLLKYVVTLREEGNVFHII